MIKTDEVIRKFLKTFLNRYQSGFEMSMKDSDFIFDYVDLLHYKCDKINLKRGGSYLDSPYQEQKKDQ